MGVKTRKGGGGHLVNSQPKEGGKISGFLFFFFKRGCIFCGLAVSLKVMLHETIRNDDL